MLLDYWHQQNPQARHIWAGMFTSRVATADGLAKPPGWPAQEIVNQIALVRTRAPGSGHVHFSMVALMGSRAGLVEQLQISIYADLALVPATAWLPADPVDGFTLLLEPLRQGAYQLQLLAQGAAAHTQRWVVWLRYGTRWEVRCTGQTLLELLARTADGHLLNAVVVSTLDRVGNESPRQGYRVIESLV